MSDRDDLTDDELKILKAFRDGDRITRARIFLATMPVEHAPAPDEAQKLEFVGTYLDCNETGRAHISKAMELLASGKSRDEVDRYLASVEACRPKAEVIDINAHRPLWLSKEKPSRNRGPHERAGALGDTRSSKVHLSLHIYQNQ